MGFLKKIFSKSSQFSIQNEGFFIALKQIMGFEPLDITHYQKAFTHRSANKVDIDGKPVNYERLEFLGDAMLSAVIASHLFNKAPLGDEGYLTKMRSKIVSREHLNELGKDFNLLQFLDSKINTQNLGDNIYGNMFEAFIGAIYLDRGFAYCERFILEKIIIPYVDIERLEGKVISYKSLLIEWCQKQKSTFFFDVYIDNGNDKERYFGVKLMINDQIIAKARATSKKKAEEIAAKRAYFALQDKIDKDNAKS
jgi:ribonuclease III|uniref:ribonuclease III n=1 Tax=Flavobacterium sp. TaxID=239 RepID=UPI004049D664